MVAEVSVMGTESAPPVESNRGSDSRAESERFRAKRAAVQARKHAQQKKLSAGNVQGEQTLENGASNIAEEAKKRRMKFRKAPELCKNMTVRESAAVRSDVDDAAAFYSEVTSARFHFMDLGNYELELEELYHGLHCLERYKESHLSPHVKHVPSLMFRTKRKLDDAVRKCGKKTVVKCDVMSRLKRKDEERSFARECSAVNVCKTFTRLGLKRRNELEVEGRNKQTEDLAKVDTANQKLNTKQTQGSRNKKRNREEQRNDGRKEMPRERRKDRRKSRWSQERKDERSRVPHEFELQVGNVECDDPEETNLMCFLLDLQNRDITPEDYDMLLRLGDKIAPKTVADDKLASLRTVTVPTLTQDGASDILWANALCAVCMEGYEEGQVVKFLPCEHFFHSHCIEMWLNNSGNTCPLDGLEV